MSATSRTRLVELSEHSPSQIVGFFFLGIMCTVVLFITVAAPVLDAFFASFLRSTVVRDGTVVVYRVADNRADELVETGQFTTWALVDPLHSSSTRLRAEYIFKPVLALAPLVVVGGTVLAALLTVIIPGGLLRQKIQREILVALDKLSMRLYGEHTTEEVARLTREIVTADPRKLHDLADSYGLTYSDADLLRKAIQWRESRGVSQLLRTHDAIKFYMREYFTDRYSNTVLGLVYMGAAVLIIVIGVRGLKFLPATDPSVVLGALGLEFILLVTYAAILMYGRTEESSALLSNQQSTHTNIGEMDANMEQLVRALLALPRNRSEER